MTPSRNAKSVTTWLRSQLRRTEPVFEALMGHSSMQAGVREYVQGLSEAADLLREANQLLAILDAGRRSVSRGSSISRTEIPAQLSPLEAKRGKVFSNHLGRFAAKHAAEFRSRVLGEELLTHDEVTNFVTSPALATTDLWTLSKHRIPPAEHKASAEPLKVHEVSGLRIYGINISATWNEGAADYLVQYSTRASPEKNPFRELSYASPRFPPIGAIARVVIWPGSVLDELLDLSLALSREFPWDPAHAAWFVLSGEVPEVAAASIGYTSKTVPDSYSHYSIKIEAQPWVDEKTVSKLYRTAQKSILKRSNRAVSERVLDVFDFVMECRVSEPDETLAELRRKWNMRNASRRYESDRGFRSAFENTEQALLHLKGTR